MKRNDLINCIKKSIPSLNNIHLLDEYYLNKLKKDVNNNPIIDSVLCEDECDLPWIIPVNYNEGIVDEELNLISEKKPNLYKMNRVVNLNITDFKYYGNKHCYGSLSISGLSWKKSNGSSILSSDLNKNYPTVRYNYNFDLRKILTEDDINEDGANWDGYEAGVPTQRFSYIRELMLTAVYIALCRVEGAFIMFNGNPCCVYKRSEALIIVDENDNVIIGNNEFKEILNKLWAYRKIFEN